MTPVTQLSLEELKAQFDEEGYIILRAFLTPEIVDGARSELTRLVDQKAEKLLAAGVISDLLKDEPFETRLIQLFEGRFSEAPNLIRPELHLPGLYPIFFHPDLLDIVESILGDEIRLYPNYSARPKLPEHEAGLVLWHQDGGYTEAGQAQPGEIGVSDLRMVNVWTPLVTAKIENGCMEFIPRTHKLGTVPHEQRQYYLEVSRDYLDTRLQNAIPIEMAPGDIVLFHNLLFHRGLPNRSKIVRWNLDWRYQDATQPTLRKENGHLARSRVSPEKVVNSPQLWASLSFT